MGVQIGGEFIGFSFGDTHSSSLGIIRTSDGSRYNQNLLPTIQDKTVQVPGGDGTYLFESFYTQRPINIPIAYDNLTEEQVGNIKRLFGDKKPKKLIFDETPYKYYWAKCTGTPNLKFICFGSNPDGTGRIYKGEGTLTFTCYDPFGYGIDLEKIPINFSVDVDAESPNYETEIEIINDGDLETDWVVTIKYPPLEITQRAVTMPLNVKISTGKDEMEISGLVFKSNNEDEIKIDSRTNLIYGVFGDQKTGNIYNEYLIKGSFFKLPRNNEGELTKIVFTLDNGNTYIKDFAFSKKYI